MVNVPYNPLPDAQPGADTPNNYLKASASPTDFGAQVGQAKEGLGRSIEQASNPAFEYAMKRQGQINEAAAVNAETQANIQYGTIFDGLRGKTGFAASASVPDAVEQAQKVRQQLRSTMPNDAAAKAFDTLIARTEGFVIRDMHSYGDTQFKAGHTKALADNRQMWVDRSARPEVALNDEAWHENMANLLASTDHELDNEGIVGDSEDAKTIKDNYIRQIKSQAWIKRITTIADDPVSGNVGTAVKVLEANKEDIPADAYSSLSRSLAGPYHSMQTREIADDLAGPNGVIWKEQQSANSGLTQSPDIVKAFGVQEGPGFGIQPGTWSQFAQPNEVVGKDDEVVATRILQKYTKDYNGDLGKVATAYFSGPGNVAPEGSPIPYINNYKDKNGKSTASYVDDILRRTQGVSLEGGIYLNKEDYIQQNFDKILQRAQDESDRRFPGHPELAYQAVQRTSQYLRSVLYQEHQLNQSALNTVNGYITDMDGKGTPMTTQYQLDLASPQVKAAWERMQAQYPTQSRALVDRFTAQNLSGKATSYGIDIYKNFQDVVNGKTQNILDLSHDMDGIKLTNTGYTALKGIMDQNNTPEGKSFNNSMSDFFQQMHTSLTTSTHLIVDDKGEDKFAKFMQAVLPEIEAKKKQGMTSGEMFSPDSKNYVGNSAHLYDRSLPQKLIDFKQARDNAPYRRILNGPAQVSKFDVKALDGVDKTKGVALLNQWFNSKQITGPQATQFAIDHGWKTKPTSGVPQANLINQ